MHAEPGAVIRNALLRHDGVRDAAVMPVPVANDAPQMTAFVVPSGKMPLTVPLLNLWLHDNGVSPHEINEIVECFNLPSDPSTLPDAARRLWADRAAHGLTTRCEDPAPIAYIQRTRHYYATLGFGAPYQWATHADAPFAGLQKPLSDCSVALVTTAARFDPEAGDQGPGAPYNAAAKFYTVYGDSTARMPDLRISHIAIDRDNSGADDIGTYFPLAALREAENAGRIGRVAGNFYGLPTNRSHRVTTTIDGPDLLKRCQKDGVDAAIFVPNCPVCHQSVTLVARILEKAGIATVILGCARDIVAAAGAPRIVFSDFPLGNAAGRPFDREAQAIVLNTALDALEQATAPGHVVQTPLTWIGRAEWKKYYANPDLLTAREIARRRAQFAEAKAIAKDMRDKDGRRHNRR